MSTLNTAEPLAVATEEHPDADRANTVEVTQIVGFRLANEEYGLDIMRVQEIILIGAITQIPQVPDYVRGLINLRGHIIPIVDLRRRFSLPDTDQTEEQRIIVVNVRDKMIGILVDSVNQVTRVTADQIEPPTNSVSGLNHEYLIGLVKMENQLIILLDVDRILTLDETQTLANISEPAQGAAGDVDRSTKK